MKKYFLSLLMVLIATCASAQNAYKTEIVLPTTGYDASTQSFVEPIKVNFTSAGELQTASTDKMPKIVTVSKDSYLDPWPTAPALPESTLDREIIVYYTLDGSDPRTSETRMVYYREYGVKEVPSADPAVPAAMEPVVITEKSDIVISKSTVLRAVTVTRERNITWTQTFNLVDMWTRAYVQAPSIADFTVATNGPVLTWSFIKVPVEDVDAPTLQTSDHQDDVQVMRAEAGNLATFHTTINVDFLYPEIPTPYTLKDEADKNFYTVENKYTTDGSNPEEVAYDKLKTFTQEEPAMSFKNTTTIKVATTIRAVYTDSEGNIKDAPAAIFVPTPNDEESTIYVERLEDPINISVKGNITATIEERGDNSRLINSLIVEHDDNINRYFIANNDAGEGLLVTLKAPEFDDPDWVEGKQIKIIFTLNGNDPRIPGVGAHNYDDIYEYDCCNVQPIIINKNAQLRAAVYYIDEDGKEGFSELYSMDFTKLVPQNLHDAVVSATEHKLMYATGTCVLNVQIDGNDYSVVKDATGTALVAGKLQVNKFYHLSEYVSEASAEIAGATFGFAEPIADIVEGGDVNILADPTVISAPMVANWFKAARVTPLCNVAFDAYYSEADEAYVQSGVNVKLIFADADLKASAATFVGSGVKFEGTLVGSDGEKAIMYVTKVVAPFVVHGTIKADVYAGETSAIYDRLNKGSQFTELTDNTLFFVYPEGSDVYTGALKFAPYVKVTANIGYTNSKIIDASICYTLKGDDPRVPGVDYLEIPVASANSSAIIDIFTDAQLRVAYKVTGVNAEGVVETVWSELISQDFKKVASTPVEKVIQENLYGNLVYTTGTCLVSTNNGYSVLADATGTLLVKGKLKVGQLYAAAGYLDVAGTRCLNMDDESTWILCKTEGEQLPVVAATDLTPENLAIWAKNTYSTPLYNVALPAEIAIIEDGIIADCNGMDICVEFEGATEDLYDGDATLTGTVLYADPDYVYMYVTGISQTPEVYVGKANIEVVLDKEVDASEDLEATVVFPDVEFVNGDRESAYSVITASLRTEDGQILKSYTIEGEIEAGYNVFDLVIPAEDINTSTVYLITIDKVMTYSDEAKTKTLNMEKNLGLKSFHTAAAEIYNTEMSFFETEFTVPVWGVNAVGEISANALKSIYLVDSKGKNKKKFAGITADGNELTFDVTGLGEDTNEWAEGLDFGIYTVIIPAGAINIDGFANPTSIRFNVTVGNDAEKELLQLILDYDMYATILEEAPCGEAVFQYLPETCSIFSKAVAKAGKIIEKYKGSVDALGALGIIKDAREQLREAYEEFNPRYPEVDEKFVIKSQAYGTDEAPLYLNICGDKAVLSSTPTPVSFHASDKLTPEIFAKLIGSKDEALVARPFTDKTYSWFIYSTEHDDYLGYKGSNSLVLSTYDAEDDHRLVNFYITATPAAINADLIVCPNTGRYLCANADEDGNIIEELFMYHSSMTPEVNLYKGNGYHWFIEEYIEPEPEPEVTPSEDESDANATVITAAQAAQLNATFYSLSGAKLSTPKKGVNIAKFADGTSKKLFVK